MHLLTSEQVLSVLGHFNIDKKLSFVEAIDFEPDCKIYILEDLENDKYALVSRDFSFDDLGAETRIFLSEFGIRILERFVSDQDNYWYADKSFDTFQYVFSLSRIEIVNN